MERQLLQLVRLTDDLLDVARITQNKLEMRRERVDLRAVLQTTVDAARPAIDAQAHSVHLRSAGGPALGRGRPDAARAGVLEPAEQRDQVHRAAADKFTSAPGRRAATLVLRVQDDRRRHSGGDAAAHLRHVHAVSGASRPEPRRSRHRPDAGASAWSSCTAGTIEAKQRRRRTGQRVHRHAAGGGRYRGGRTRRQRAAAAAPRPPCRILVADDNADALEMLHLMLVALRPRCHRRVRRRRRGDARARHSAADRLPRHRHAADGRLRSARRQIRAALGIVGGAGGAHRLGAGRRQAAVSRGRASTITSRSRPIRKRSTR